MAKKTRRAARVAPATPQIGSIFDHFKAHRPEMLGSIHTDEPAPRQPAPKTSDYDAQLAELRRHNEELNRRLNETPLPTAARTAPTQVITPKDVTFSTDGLPDPTLEPEKYNRELQTRINATLEANRAAMQAEQAAASSQQQTSAALWNQFAELYPDWASDEEKVRFAAESVINAARAKGLDTEAYITTHATRFCNDVAKKLETTFGPIESDDDDEDETEDDFDFDEVDEEEAPRTRRRADPNDDDGRTAGIFGGHESGGTPARGKTERRGDMIADIMDLQKKSGFF